MYECVRSLVPPLALCVCVCVCMCVCVVLLSFFFSCLVLIVGFSLSLSQLSSQLIESSSCQKRGSPQQPERGGTVEREGNDRKGKRDKERKRCHGNGVNHRKLADYRKSDCRPINFFDRTTRHLRRTEDDQAWWTK